MKIKAVRCTIERDSGHTQRNVEIPFDAFIIHVDSGLKGLNGDGIFGPRCREITEQIMKEFPLPKEGY